MAKFQLIKSSMIKDKFKNVVNKAQFKVLYDKWNTTGTMNVALTEQQVVDAVYAFSKKRMVTKREHVEEIYDCLIEAIKPANVSKLQYGSCTSLFFICDETEKNAEQRVINGEDVYVKRVNAPQTFYYTKEQKELITENGFNVDDITNNKLFSDVFATILIQAKSEKQKLFLIQEYVQITYLEFQPFQPKLDLMGRQALKTLIFKGQNKPKYFLQLLLSDDNTNHFIDSKYVEYDIKKSATKWSDLAKSRNCTYVTDNFKPNSCLLTAVLNCFYDVFVREEMKPPTYEYLCEIANMDCNASDNACSVEQLEPFFEKHALTYRLYTKDMILIHEYAPKAKTIKKIMHLIISGNHCYLINRNLKSLERLTCEKFDIPESLPEKTEKDEYTYYSMPKEEDMNVEVFVIKTFDEMLVSFKSAFEKFEKSEKKEDEPIINVRFITNNVHKLFFEVHNSGWEVNASFKKHKLCSFSFNKNIDKHEMHCSVQYPIDVEDDNEREIHVNTVEEYKILHQMRYKIQSKLLNKKYISYYHKQVTEVETYYPIMALNMKFGEEETKDLSGLDCSKFYTSILYRLKKLPVFDYFDLYEQVEKNHVVEDLNIYIISSKHTLCQQSTSRVFGFIVKQIEKEGYAVTLHEYKKPKEIVDCDFENVIKDIFATKVDSSIIKDVMNISIGKLGKKTNLKSKTYLYKDKLEAECNCYKYNTQDIEQLKDDKDNKLYVVNINTEQELLNGFRNINELIVQMGNLLIWQDYNKLMELGFEVVGIKTDCILYKTQIDNSDWADMVDDISSENQLEILQQNFKFGKRFGQYKEELNKTTKCLKFGQETIKRMTMTYYNNRKSHEFTREEEFDVDCKAMLNVIQTSTESVIVCADIAGAGKSYVCKKISEKILFVCPYNTLCEELKLNNIEAITVCKLLGINPSGKTVMYDITKFDTIVFDEVMLNDATLRLKMSILMQRNQHIKWIANGDISQLNPITERYDGADAYRQKSIDIMFPVKLNLHHVKRGETDEDNKQLTELKKDMFALKDSAKIFALLKTKYKVPVIKVISALKTTRNICYFRKTRAMCNDEYMKRLNRNGTMTEQVRIDDIVLASSYHKFSKFKIHTNVSFMVSEINEKFVIIYNLNDMETPLSIPVEIFNKKFCHAYGQTIDSIQGCTIAENCTFFDLQSEYCDFKYSYTMLSRLRSLKYATLFEYSEYQLNRLHHNFVFAKIMRDIEGHKDADKTAKRDYKDDEFVDFAWVKKQMTIQESLCGRTCEPLTIETCSIDRIDNNIAHLKSNCRLTSWLANVSAGNRMDNYFDA